MRRRQGFLWNTKTYILGTFNITILFSIKFFANHYLWNAISAKVGIYFHDGRSRFYYERLRFSLWQVEIFVMKVWDFLMNGRDFRDDRSRFSWWKVGIFMMTGRDFHDDRSRFSWWQMEIFLSVPGITETYLCNTRNVLRDGVSPRFHFLVFDVNQRN